jgi:uncharacterized protein with HEPN domain
MSLHDDTIRMRHMLDHALEAVRYGGGKSSREIETDRLLNLAIVRLLEIIGEAAGRVSSETREAHSHIPWRATINLRNRLIHGYDTVDYEVVKQIIEDDLPPLIVQLTAILFGRNPSVEVKTS